MVENVLSNLELKQRSDIHWARKIWHMSGVFFIFALWMILPPALSYTLLIICTALFVPADILRHRRPALNDFLVHAFRPIMRTHEINRLAGTTYLLTGVTFVAIVFPRDVASLTMLFLAFADPLASLIGIKYGKDKIFGHKSLQGFIAAYFVCFACSFVYLFFRGYAPDRTLVFSILAGLIGALAELVPIWKLDDNLTLPVLSSIGLFGLFYFFGFL
jgi:dolichol kinase